MSRVMYNYRIDKARWWELARDVREVYAEHHPAALAVKKVTPTDSAGTLNHLNALDKVVDALDKESLTVDLQLFDEGGSYIVRPLERGWFFFNNAQRWVDGFSLERVFYDDRGDVPADQESNRKVSVWCDQKIADGEFLIFPVLTRDSLHLMGLDRVLFNR